MAVRFDVKFATAADSAALSPVFTIAATDMIVQRYNNSCLLLS